ncbi:hypothetical protein CR513_44494, partial [Mucuna pruriens]
MTCEHAGKGLHALTLCLDLNQKDECEHHDTPRPVISPHGNTPNHGVNSRPRQVGTTTFNENGRSKLLGTPHRSMNNSNQNGAPLVVVSMDPSQNPRNLYYLHLGKNLEATLVTKPLINHNYNS